MRFFPIRGVGTPAGGRVGVVACGMLAGLLWACLQFPGPLGLPDHALAARPSSLSSSKKQMVRQLYRRLCASCHRNDHRGEPGQIPDFTRRSWQDRRSNAQLLATILEGKGSRMPAFRRKLTEGQARDLVGYLREVGGSEIKAARAAPDDVTRRFEELRKELEELQRQFRQLAPNSHQKDKKK
jgi:mono/diheme cytochrome c family protein